MGTENSVQLIENERKDAVTFVDDKFNVKGTVNHLHKMMKEVTKDQITPDTVNAACNCVSNLNETIKTAMSAARFINGR